MMDHLIPETILVTGAGGQLGREVKELSLSLPQYRFLFASRSELPIDDQRALTRYFESSQIHYCINCAAYTAVDKAESEKELAFLINGESVGQLAALCRDHKTKLIHISTDYVYDGTTRQPLKEDDAVAPLNVYGMSKLRGEELALSNDPESIIIRTSWVYSRYGQNFLKTMMRLLVEKNELNVVADQIGSPTYAADLARVIFEFIKKNSEGEPFSGIYNYSNYGVTNWFQFAGYIRERIGSSCRINPVTTSQYPTAAIRPLYSVLDTSKIRSALGIDIPFWKDSVSECIDRIISQA